MKVRKTGKKTVTIEFASEKEFNEFLVGLEVDEELKNYGEGVLRTIARGKKHVPKKARSLQ